MKGNYGVVKENTSSSQLVSKNSVYNLLVYKKCKFINVLCQSIKYNSEKKPVPYGNKLSIPITYGGWFEVLSEDGKSIKLLNSVKELANHSQSIYNLKKRSNKSSNSLANLTSYLIRETLNAYTISTGLIVDKELKTNGSLFETEYSTASLNDCKKVIVKTGDRIQIVGEVYLENLTSGSSEQSQKALSSQPQRRLLKCRLERGSSKQQCNNLDSTNKSSIDDVFSNMNMEFLTNTSGSKSSERSAMGINGEKPTYQIVYLPEEAKGWYIDTFLG